MDSIADSVWKRGRVWTREGSHTMARGTYALMVTFWTAAGIASSAIAAYFTQGWPVTLQLLLGVLVVSIVGILIALRSANPFVSLVGYALVTIPFGALTGPVVALYAPASVVRILFLTTGLVVVLGVAGAVYPRSLEGMGSWLLGGLLLLLVGMLLGPRVGISLTALDWVGVVLFSAYVVYDLNRAMNIPYTMDNAIDSALAIYLDFINIFIRLLELYGKKKD